jgi:hypothetical protein
MEELFDKPVVRFAAKLENVCHFLLDFLVLVLLAYLDHLNHRRVKLCLQKVGKLRSRLWCLHKDWQKLADLTLVNDVKKASFPHFRDYPLNSLGMFCLKAVAVVI